MARETPRSLPVRGSWFRKDHPPAWRPFQPGFPAPAAAGRGVSSLSTCAAGETPALPTQAEGSACPGAASLSVSSSLPPPSGRGSEGDTVPAGCFLPGCLRHLPRSKRYSLRCLRFERFFAGCVCISDFLGRKFSLKMKNRPGRVGDVPPFEK